MINHNIEKNASKFCIHRTKLIDIDKDIKLSKKFCNRECYLSFLRKKEEKPKPKTFWQTIHETLRSFKCFIILLVLLRPISQYEKVLSPCIIFKPLLLLDTRICIDYWEDIYLDEDIFIINNKYDDTDSIC